MDTQTSMSIFGLAQAHNNGSQSDRTGGKETTAFVTLLNGEIAANTAAISPLISAPQHSSSNAAPDLDSGFFLNRLWETGTSSVINSATPATFVHSIKDAAKRAAQELGTPAAAVIAVAAHETGWGKHIIESDTAGSSHNLFGIKSFDKNPETTAFAQTTEYIDGVKKSLSQPFRTYSSANDSVADFAQFIQSNPRYANALSQAQDASAFIEQIHLAGYATDPDYASKVKSVMLQVEQILRNDHKESGQ